MGGEASSPPALMSGEASSSGGTIGGARGADVPPDSRVVKHGAPVHQVVNIKAYA